MLNFKVGGVSWYRQSRLTVWGNRSFNRLIYERRPQTPLNKLPINRYSKYYNSGLTDQGLDISRAFQGIFLQGIRMPYNFSLKGVIGKVILIALSLKLLIILLALFKSKTQ